MNVIHMGILIFSVIAAFCGAAGMTICLYFLFSIDPIEMVSAGYGFIAGSVLFGCGLISAAISARSIRD